MGISAICNYGYSNSYQRVNKASSDKSFATSMNTFTQITLKMTDEATGDEAHTCVGFPNGESASVYKADNYTDANPQYRVKYWDNMGEEREYFVDPRKVAPSNASYVEMLVYSTYADIQGGTNDAFGKFLTVADGVNVARKYDLSNIDTKMDFKSLIK